MQKGLTIYRLTHKISLTSVRFEARSSKNKADNRAEKYTGAKMK